MLRVINFICRITRPEADVTLELLSWRKETKWSYRGVKVSQQTASTTSLTAPQRKDYTHFYYGNLNNLCTFKRVRDVVLQGGRREGERERGRKEGRKEGKREGKKEERRATGVRAELTSFSRATPAISKAWPCREPRLDY